MFFDWHTTIDGIRIEPGLHDQRANNYYSNVLGVTLQVIKHKALPLFGFVSAIFSLLQCHTYLCIFFMNGKQ